MPPEGMPKGPRPEGKWIAWVAFCTHWSRDALRPGKCWAAHWAVATAPARAVGRKAEMRSVYDSICASLLLLGAPKSSASAL